MLVPPLGFSPASLAYFCPFMVCFSFKIKLIKMCAGKRCCEQGPQRLLQPELVWLVTHLDLEQPIGKVSIESIPLLHSQTLQSQDCFNNQHVRDSIANSLPTEREKHCSSEDREQDFIRKLPAVSSSSLTGANPANTVVQFSQFLPD